MAATSTAAFAGDAHAKTAGDEQGKTASHATMRDENARHARQESTANQATVEGMGSAGREPATQVVNAKRADYYRDSWLASIWASP